MSDSENELRELIMNLNDIIKTDADRLFRLDDECYILFTGDSVNDEHPFIRIGNWVNMPVELIPLIKNIVITDNITGNPSYEQFNIDPKHLEANRYIGSAEIVKSYIEFQKLFGLDLAGVEIVDIKKDIPELSREKNISDDDQFIGVFYRDGSFKTLHNRNTIIEIKGLNTASDFAGYSTPNSSAYSEAGLIILDGNPVFFSNNNFISYLLPHKEAEAFKNANIDTGRIKAIVYPSKNYPELISFIKNKRIGSNKMFIFSGLNEDIRMIKKFFSNIPLENGDLNNMHFTGVSGMLAENYPNSPNIKVTFNDGIKIAFIKSTTGIQHTIKDKLDAIIICYTAYKDSVLLFKSTETPIALINDTEENNITARLGLQNISLLHPGTVYKFSKINDAAEIGRYYCGRDMELINEETDDAENKLKQLKENVPFEEASATRLFNIISLLRMRINSSADRNQYRQAQRLYLELTRDTENLPFYGHSSHVLVLQDSGLYVFVPPSATKTIRDEITTYGKTTDSDSADKMQIERDRARLMQLLALFKNDGILGNIKSSAEITSLSKTIASRRKQYGLPAIQPITAAYDTSEQDGFIHERTNQQTAAQDEPPVDYLRYIDKKIIKDTDSVTGKALSVLNNMRSLYNKMPKNKKIAILSAPLLLVFLLLFALVSGDEQNGAGKNTAQNNTTHKTNYQGKNELDKTNGGQEGTNGKDNNGAADLKPTPSDTVLSDEKIKFYESMPSDFKSEITDNDIYRYVNQVAVKNGYRELSATEMQSKNPDRIFPKDTFTMLDGQIVTVVDGDTLWNIAAKKLIEQDINFYEIVKQLKNSKAAEKQKLIESARSMAFSKRHMEIMDSL